MYGAFKPICWRLFADLTFGGGGHSGKILEANAGSRLLAMDCDPDAKARAESLSESYGDRFKFVDSAFQTVDQYAGAEEFDGVLMDLGISSFQLMEARKGFPSDWMLRLICVSIREGLSAAEFLETASRESLVRAIREYGEERRWSRVVNAIIEARGTGQLQRTLSAADLVTKAVGGCTQSSVFIQRLKHFRV